MNVQFKKWGNSLAVRIPAPMAEAIGATEGSEAQLVREDDALVLKLVRVRYDLADLVAKITDENRHDEIDTGAPVGAEEW